mgnify:CR=1 FL=1
MSTANGFPLLDEFTEGWEHSTVDVQTLRTPGHLSERLLNIFLAHKQRVGANWKSNNCSAYTSLDPAPIEALEPSGR